MKIYKVLIDGEIYDIRANNTQQMLNAYTELKQNIEDRKQKNQQ